MPFIDALETRLVKYETPFAHWTVDTPLTEQAVAQIYAAPIPTGPVIFDGTRAGDKSGKNLLSKLRLFVTRDNYQEFPALADLIYEMQSKECQKIIADIVQKDLSNSFVRLEIIADKDGFWLEPHLDIEEKLMSSIIFVNLNGENENLGTDFYNEDKEIVKTIPYKNNYGYIFTSGEKTWHGLAPKKIKKERRCIQLNYVTFETDWPVA